MVLMEKWEKSIKFEKCDCFIYNFIRSYKNKHEIIEISDEILQNLKEIIVLEPQCIKIILPIFIEIEDLAQIFDSLLSEDSLNKSFNNLY